MKTIQAYLLKKQAAFKDHPFFKDLSEQDDFTAGMAFVPRLYFWVMAFQDILRIIPSQLKTTHLRRIAIHHRHEDSGHDKWFLEDLSFLGKKPFLTIEWLFSPEHQITRDVAYSITSEVFKGTEHQKIILILALESTGHIFFENIAKFAKSNGHDSDLKYLSSYHLEAERSHEIFEKHLISELFNVVLSEEDRNEAIAMIDRVYDAFNILFDYLLEGLAGETTLNEPEELQSLVA